MSGGASPSVPAPPQERSSSGRPAPSAGPAASIPARPRPRAPAVPGTPGAPSPLASASHTPPLPVPARPPPLSSAAPSSVPHRSQSSPDGAGGREFFIEVTGSGGTPKAVRGGAGPLAGTGRGRGRGGTARCPAGPAHPAPPTTRLGG